MTSVLLWRILVFTSSSSFSRMVLCLYTTLIQPLPTHVPMCQNTKPIQPLSSMWLYQYQYTAQFHHNLPCVCIHVPVGSVKKQSKKIFSNIGCIQKKQLCNTVSTQQSINGCDFVGLRYPPRHVRNRPTKPNCQYLAQLQQNIGCVTGPYLKPLDCEVVRFENTDTVNHTFP